MRFIRWLAIPVMLILGVGAVWFATSERVGSASAPTTALTSVAELTTVSQDVAATGNVQPAEQLALAFGAQPSMVSSAAAGGSSSYIWTVKDVAVSLGQSVTTGEVLATADTADVQADLDALDVKIADAQRTLDDATTTRAHIRADTKDKLATAENDLIVAQLNVANAKAAYTASSGTTARRQARISVIQARAQLTIAQQAVDDDKTALKGDFPDETQAVADAQAALDDLTSQEADLQQQMELATLRAPTDGVVSELDITAGYPAPSGTAMVIDSVSLEVVADVVESDLGSIALGQAATVTLAALGLDAPGTVTAIAPSTTSSTSSVVTYPVTVTLTDPDARIRSGMSTDVAIATAVAKDAIAVPVAALHGFSGSYSVGVVGTDGTTQERPVQVGLVTEALAQITSGVSAGERVVIGTNTARSSTTSGTTPVGGLGGGGFPTGGFPTGGFPGAGR